MAGNSKNKEKTSLASITIPAIIGAISTIAAAYFSYSAGVNAVQIPINYTLTAEVRQPPAVQTMVVTQPPLIITRVVEVTPTPDDKVLSVESIPATVSAYLDNDTDPSQSSTLEVINSNGSGVIYQHRYSFPDNAEGYAGINFQFDTLQDFSTYNVIELTIAIDGTPEGCDLYFHDATGNRYPVSCQTPFFTDKQTNTIPLKKYAEVNMKAIRNIYILIHPNTSKGEVKVALWNLRFIRQ